MGYSIIIEYSMTDAKKGRIGRAWRVRDGTLKSLQSSTFRGIMSFANCRRPYSTVNARRSVSRCAGLPNIGNRA